MIRELVIVSKDKVGLLADISYVLAKEKINIEQVDASVLNENAVVMVGVLSARYEKAKEALEKNRYKVLPSESIIVKLEDKPGALAEMSRKLADAKINMTNIHVLGKDGEYVFDSVTVDKPKEARKVLGSAVVNESE